eukprot:m.34899 g.34899  ORF g.34899 m.34899 type:complete len:360 (+) comp8802_c0_seq1:50-1129(+)
MSWQWKRDLRKGDTDEDSWEDYDEVDSKKIEAGFKAKKKTIKLNNKYTINYAESIQYRTGEKNRQRDIRRVEEDEQPKKKTGKMSKAKASGSKPSFHWYWKQNLNLKDANPKGWTEYDEDIASKIENGYSKNSKAKKFVLDSVYCIDFVDMIQYRKDDRERQRPITRLSAGEDFKTLKTKAATQTVEEEEAPVTKKAKKAPTKKTKKKAAKYTGSDAKSEFNAKISEALEEAKSEMEEEMTKLDGQLYIEFEIHVDKNDGLVSIKAFSFKSVGGQFKSVQIAKDVDCSEAVSAGEQLESQGNDLDQAYSDIIFEWFHEELWGTTLGTPEKEKALKKAFMKGVNGKKRFNLKSGSVENKK